MRWKTFWVIHRWAYLVVMWIVSIKFGMLGVFFLVTGFQRPLFWAFAVPCISLGACVNPWIVSRCRRS